jgi:DNA-binding NarL/FixJ family response regulator
MIRILIADDHKQVRKALRGTLEEYEWQVCGEASDGQEAVSLALQLKPDVAILDLSMPGLDGIEATRQMKKALPGVEVLIFTMYDAEEMILNAYQAGARGFILKSDSELEIVNVIKVITRHEPSAATASQSLGEKFFRPPCRGGL